MQVLVNLRKKKTPSLRLPVSTILAKIFLVHSIMNLFVQMRTLWKLIFYFMYYFLFINMYFFFIKNRFFYAKIFLVRSFWNDFDMNVFTKWSMPSEVNTGHIRSPFNLKIHSLHELKGEKVEGKGFISV